MRTRIVNRIKRLLGIRAVRAAKSFPRSPGISVHESLIMENFRNIQIVGDCKIDIAEGVIFRQFCNLLVYPGARFKIDHGVFFNNYCSINCLGMIEIGEFTMFGEGVKLFDHNHEYHFDNGGILNIDRQKLKIGRIKIGKNCWIGSNVTILNNVEIGDNVLVGANCLIYKSIPSNTIVKHTQQLTFSHQ